MLKLSGGKGFGRGGVERLRSLEQPPSSGKFQPPRGSLQPPIAHITSLSMNGLLLITTRPPSTTMHCIPCVWSFGHLLVIKINFSAKQSTKIRLFKIKNLKFSRTGHCPLPQRDRGGTEGPLPISHTARVPRFDLLTS